LKTIYIPIFDETKKSLVGRETKLLCIQTVQINQYLNVPDLENKDSENLFSNREREKNLIKSMSPCPRVENKDRENLFSNRERKRKT